MSCLSRSQTGCYLASGDRGPDHHALYVWSVGGRKPVLRLLNPHGTHGVDVVAFTANDRWLVSVGGAANHQSVCVWDWTNAPETPVSCTALAHNKLFSYIAVHPRDENQFLVSSKTTATFFLLDTNTSELRSHNPGSVEKEFGKSVGHLTQSVYLRTGNQVLSATNRGNLVAWQPGQGDAAAAAGSYR